MQFVSRGHGGLFFDPHGDAADRLLLLIPKRRTRDIIFLDPNADFVPPFNPLAFDDKKQLQLAIETCLTILKAMSGSDEAWGNETPYRVRNALDAICELIPNPNLVHVFRFLLDEAFPTTILETSHNPLVKLFKQSNDKLRALAVWKGELLLPAVLVWRSISSSIPTSARSAGRNEEISDRSTMQNTIAGVKLAILWP